MAAVPPPRPGEHPHIPTLARPRRILVPVEPESWRGGPAWILHAQPRVCCEKRLRPPPQNSPDPALDSPPPASTPPPRARCRCPAPPASHPPRANPAPPSLHHGQDPKISLREVGTGTSQPLILEGNPKSPRPRHFSPFSPLIQSFPRRPQDLFPRDSQPPSLPPPPQNTQDFQKKTHPILGALLRGEGRLIFFFGGGGTLYLPLCFIFPFQPGVGSSIAAG